MAEHAMDLVLWEGVRDGDLKQASWALEQGADPNRKFCVSKDSYGRSTWDFSNTGYLPWRHILITSNEKMGIFQPPTRSVPTLPVNCSNGDTLLHIAVKLQWHELASLLASRVEIDEFVRNDNNQTPQEIANNIGEERMSFYNKYFVGETNHQKDSRSSDNQLIVKNNALTSPVRIGRNEFRKSAVRSLEYEIGLKKSQFASPTASTKNLAGYVEQEMLQLERSPAPNDETVIPRFPRGQRVPVELPERSWRAPTLNESAISFTSSSLPTVRELLQCSDDDVLAKAVRDFKGRRFMLMRPSVSLVNVHSVHPSSRHALCAQPQTSIDQVNTQESHLLVTYQADGETGTHTKPLGWFRANSRPAATPKIL